MGWTEPQYSGTRRTSAGIALAKGLETIEDLIVIDNWRSSHALPLQVIKMMLKGRAKSVDADSIVAQRLKRLPSIRAKLQRETMRLQQMQDLGGCRAIMKDMGTLGALLEKFEESAKKAPKRKGLRRHELISKDDYLRCPKADGYRSVHYVYAYRTNTPHLRCFDGLLIEVQVRTRLQHAWATAVEVVDTFTGQSIKSALRTNIGDESWRRFFALMSSALARREKAPLVPGTPTDYAELREEMRTLATATNVVQVLQGLGTAVMMSGTEKSLKHAVAYVLKLDTRARTVEISPFKRTDLAQEQLFKEERESAADPAIQVVQVSVERMQTLKTAYPNFYLDTTLFIDALRRVIATKSVARSA